MSNYFTYITTNSIRTVLYIAITNDLERRMTEHFEKKATRRLSPENMVASISFILSGPQTPGLRLSGRKN
jgi:predicted GIY-YIG superfamily endonuclease